MEGIRLATKGSCVAYTLLVCCVVSALISVKASRDVSTSPSRTARQYQGFEPRIVGGIRVMVGEIPYLLLVRIRRENASFRCGASIISNSWAVTAAHCVFGSPPENLTLTAGDNDLDRVEGTEVTIHVSKVVIHWRYKDQENYHDIALLKFSHSIQFNRHIQSIALPEPYSQNKGTVVVSGWGTTMFKGTVTPLKMAVELNVTEREECKKYYPNLSINQLCAGMREGRKDSCQGDSGGPLAKMSTGEDPLLVGVVSGGIGCGQYPGVYVNVPCYRRWIDRTISSQ